MTAAQLSELDAASNACLELCSRHGFATGHGDTVADIIREIDVQITERVAAKPADEGVRITFERESPAPDPCSDLSVGQLIEWLDSPQYTNGFLDFDAANHMSAAAELLDRLIPERLPALSTTGEPKQLTTQPNLLAALLTIRDASPPEAGLMAGVDTWSAFAEELQKIAGDAVAGREGAEGADEAIVLGKRPVAFRVRRAEMNGLVLSNTDWRLFNNEDEARIEAYALMTDYQGLYVRDGMPLTVPPKPAPDAMRSGKVHYLKTLPKYFEEVLSGRKGFEWRFADRDFAIGDTLILQEWKPERENYKSKEGTYTGREIERLVTYLFTPPPANERTIVMSIVPLSAPVPPADGATSVLETVDAIIDQFENDTRVLYPDSEVLMALGKIRDAVSPPSGTGAAEPVAWRAFCAKTGGQMINPPATKDLLIEQADRLYAEHGYILQPLYAAPTVRGDREAIARVILKNLHPQIKDVEKFIHAFDEEYQRALALADAILSSVRPGAGERGSDAAEADRYYEMAGEFGNQLQTLAGVAQDAVDILAERKHGNAARSPSHNALVILETALKNVSPSALPARQAPHSSSGDGR